MKGTSCSRNFYCSKTTILAANPVNNGNKVNPPNDQNLDVPQNAGNNIDIILKNLGVKQNNNQENALSLHLKGTTLISNVGCVQPFSHHCDGPTLMLPLSLH